MNYFAVVRENFGRTLVTMKMVSSGCIQKKLCFSWMKSVMLQFYWNIIVYFVQIALPFIAIFSCFVQTLVIATRVGGLYYRVI